MEKDGPSEFWQRLLEAGKPLGWPTTQMGLAKVIGRAYEGREWNQSRVRRWYTGTATPEKPVLAWIAKTTGCRLEWLQEGKGEPRDRPTDPDLLDLIRHWNQLKPEGRVMVLRQAKLEHAMQFTGDDERRDSFHEMLKSKTGKT